MVGADVLGIFEAVLVGSIIFVLKAILSDDVAEGVILACDNVVAREGVWLLSTVYMKRTKREN